MGKLAIPNCFNSVKNADSFANDQGVAVRKLKPFCTGNLVPITLRLVKPALNFPPCALSANQSASLSAMNPVIAVGAKVTVTFRSEITFIAAMVRRTWPAPGVEMG